MNSEADFLDRYLHRIDSGQPFVIATVVEAHGSVPTEVGARAIVTQAGLDFGTIGGGKLEARALRMSLEMLEGHQDYRFEDWSLKADVGMTCGGRVKLFFERCNRRRWTIAIFGAGHVSQAVARLLTTIPCKVIAIDPRQDWLDRYPTCVLKVRLDNPRDYVSELPDESFVLCMTRGHSSDLPVLREIARRTKPFLYVGAIGSAAKKAVLQKELRADGADIERFSFHCPVGLPIGSNHPGEIAISIVAQLLEVKGQVMV